jgi:hypothetical protein
VHDLVDGVNRAAGTMGVFTAYNFALNGSEAFNDF